MIRVNVNKQLNNLLSGYQDLMDRYGSDDPLVRQMKDAIVQQQMRQQQQQPPPPRRRATIRAGEWSAGSRPTGPQP